MNKIQLWYKYYFNGRNNKFITFDMLKNECPYTIVYFSHKTNVENDILQYMPDSDIWTWIYGEGGFFISPDQEQIFTSDLLYHYGAIFATRDDAIIFRLAIGDLVKFF